MKFNTNIFQRYIKILPLCITACLMVDCKNLESQISIPVTYSKSNILLSDIAEDYKIIQFESTEKSAVGNIKKMAFLKDIVFILDKKNNCVLSFNEKGKFLNTTKPLLGRAKGEYISIEDMAVDEETATLYVFCDRPNKILILDKNLKFIEEKSLNVYPIEITISGKYVYCYCYDKGNIKERKLVRFNKNMRDENVEVLFKTSETIPGIETFGASLSSNRNEELNFGVPFSNSIIHKGKDRTTTMSFDFGDKWFSYEESKELQPRKFLKDNENSIWAIKNISTGSKNAFFTTNQSTIFVYDNGSETCTGYKGIENDILPFNSPFIVPKQGADNSIAFYMSVSTMLHLKEKWNMIISVFENRYKRKLDKRVEEIVESFTETSNPVVIMYNMK